MIMMGSPSGSNEPESIVVGLAAFSADWMCTLSNNSRLFNFASFPTAFSKSTEARLARASVVCGAPVLLFFDRILATILSRKSIFSPA